MSVIPRINIENIKNEINKTLGESYKQKLYWDSFRKFALSKLSKREWDSCVRDLLGARPENVAIHNTLVRSMLANARYSYNKEDYKVDIEALKAKYHQQQQQQQQQQQLLQEQQSLYNESIAASSIGKVVKAKPSKRIHPYEVPLAAPSTPLTPIEDESKPLRRRKLKATVSQVPPSPTMVSTPTTTTTTTTLMTPIPKVRATVSTPTREKKGKNVLGAPPSTVNGTASPPTKKSGKGVLKRAHAEAAEAQSVAAVPEQELKKKKVKRGLASTSEAVPPQAAASAMAVPPLPGSAAAAAAATAAAAMAAMPVPMQPVPAIPLAPVIPEFVPPPAENPFFFQETFYTGPVNAQGKPIPSISTRPGASDLLRQELPTLFEFLQQPTPELPDREAIQTRMKKIADESDLKDVAPECAEVMQRSMEFYLKQIISKCLELKRKPQSLRLQHLLRQQRQQQYQYQSPAAATSGSTTNRLLLNINTNRSRLSPAPTMVGGSIPLANGNNFDASAQQQQLRAGTYAAPPITSASSPPAGTMATTTTTTTSIPGVDHIITPRDLLTTIDICPYLLGEDHEKFREKISMTNWDLC